MRIKHGNPVARVARDSLDAAVREHLGAPRPRWRPSYNAAVLMAIVIATGWALATSGVTTDVDDTRANRATDITHDCSARYAALLDLAELARRDGKASEIVLRGLSDRRGALGECLPTGRSRTVKR